MKKFFIYTLVCLVLISALANTVSASEDYGTQYNEALSLAQSIQSSVTLLNKHNKDYPNQSLYNRVKPMVDSVLSGKLELLGQTISLKDPKGISFAVGPVKQDIVSDEQVKEIAASMMKIYISVLTPVEEQLKYDALDYTPPTFENLNERSRVYAKELTQLVDATVKLLNENDFSKAVTSENIGKIVTLLLSGKANQTEIITVALDILMSTPNLGSDVAVEVGLLAGRASNVMQRAEKLYADAKVWYATDPAKAREQTGKTQNDYIKGLKSSVEVSLADMSKIIAAATKSFLGK